MVEEFKKSYKNGYEVMLSPEERDQLVEYIKELEHGNNIINELEKYIIDFKEDYEKNEFQPNAKVYIYWKDLIDKIQELKGEKE